MSVTPIHGGTLKAPPIEHSHNGEVHGGRMQRGKVEHGGRLQHGKVDHGGRLQHGKVEHGGRLQHGKVEHGGRLQHGKVEHGGRLHGDAEESPQLSAQAEINNLVSSLGALASQAGSLPLTPPALPGLPQNQGYQPQPTDYTYDAN